MSLLFLVFELICSSILIIGLIWLKGGKIASLHSVCLFQISFVFSGIPAVTTWYNFILEKYQFFIVEFFIVFICDGEVSFFFSQIIGEIIGVDIPN